MLEEFFLPLDLYSSAPSPALKLMFIVNNRTHFSKAVNRLSTDRVSWGLLSIERLIKKHPPHSAFFPYCPQARRLSGPINRTDVQRSLVC
jgi:hypothetical protein